MSQIFKVRCTSCGCPNELKIGRIYNRLSCQQCGAEIDTDASVTLDILLESKPVTLVRDTVTVGFRSREHDDSTVCPKCGTQAALEVEDVLEIGKKYKCSHCHHEFDMAPKAKCGQAIAD